MSSAAVPPEQDKPVAVDLKEAAAKIVTREFLDKNRDVLPMDRAPIALE